MVPNSSSEDSQLPFLNDISTTSLTDILGTLTDSNFKQVADNGDVFEHIDFTDMFTQLKDVMTPEKSKNMDKGEVSDFISVHTVCVLYGFCLLIVLLHCRTVSQLAIYWIM